MAYELRLHFVDKVKNVVIAKYYAYSVPCLGDEVRMEIEGKTTFYKVVQVVHVYDEDVTHHRANIGLERIE